MIPVETADRSPREVCELLIGVMRYVNVPRPVRDGYFDQLEHLRDEALDPFMATLIEVIDNAAPAELTFTANAQGALAFLPTEE